MPFNTKWLTGELIITHLLSGYFVFRLCDALSGRLIALPVIRDRAINGTMLRLNASVIGTLLFLWILVTGLTKLGSDMVPLIAGPGVGGLAITSTATAPQLRSANSGNRRLLPSPALSTRALPQIPPRTLLAI